MFVMNGIVYGGEPEMPLKVNNFKILPDKIMLIMFSNGETRLFDGTALKGDIFEKLNDETIFNNAELDHGVITWLGGDIDCAPEFMYENSYEVV
ncbi:MAG: DUF2442 domain-containing protein [Lachnospiraceae bacterium]|nr:DUF2442 domain-containing protein [Lachnospiraceae bacterium]